MFSQETADAVDFSVLNQLAMQFDCICDRKQSDLMCIDCKRQLYGRLYQPCGRHPFVSNLYLFFHDFCSMTINSLPILIIFFLFYL